MSAFQIEGPSGASGSSDLPVGTQVAVLLDMGWTNTAGTWGVSGVAGQLISAVQNTSSHAQNDEVTFTFEPYLSVGTWRADLAGIFNSDRAIWTLKVAGSTVGTADFYASGIAFNVGRSITGIVIGSAGTVTVAIKAATRNASASDWYCSIIGIVFTRTA